MELQATSLKLKYSENLSIGNGFNHKDSTSKPSPFISNFELLKEDEKINNYSLNHYIVTNYKEYAQAFLKLSNEGTLNWDPLLFANNAKKFFNYKMNEVLFIVQKKIHCGLTKAKNSMEFNDLAKKILKEKGLKNFHDIYGNYYISEKVEGLVLTMIFTFQTKKFIKNYSDIDQNLLNTFEKFGLCLNSGTQFKEEITKNNDLTFIRTDVCYQSGRNKGREIKDYEFNTLNLLMTSFPENEFRIPLNFFLQSYELINDYIEICLFDLKGEINQMAFFNSKQNQFKFEAILNILLLVESLKNENEQKILELKDLGINLEEVIKLLEDLPKLEENDKIISIYNKLIEFEDNYKKNLLIKPLIKKEELEEEKQEIKFENQENVTLEFIKENLNDSFRIVNVNENSGEILRTLCCQNLLEKDKRDKESVFLYAKTKVCSLNGLKWKFKIVNKENNVFTIVSEEDDSQISCHNYYGKDKRKDDSYYVMTHKSSNNGNCWKIIPKGKFFEIINEGDFSTANNEEGKDQFNVRGLKLSCTKEIEKDLRLDTDVYAYVQKENNINTNFKIIKF